MAQDKRSVRTEQPDDVQVQLVDATTPTQGAEIDASGRLHVYDERDATDPLPVFIADEPSGTTQVTDYAATASLAAQASETVQSTVIPNTETARFRGVTVSSEAPFKAEIRTNGGSPATIAVLHGEAGATVQWEPKALYAAANELLGDGVTTYLEVVITNNGTAAIGPSAVSHVTIEYQTEA